MNKTLLVLFVAATISGCASDHCQSKQIEKSLKRQHKYDHGWRAEKRNDAYMDWVTSDPRVEVAARTKRGVYSFLGIANHGAPCYWIPGIADKTNNPPRCDAEYHGIGVVDSAGEAAEEYMSKFNLLMLDARKGITIDIYGHSRVHPNFIEQKKP